MTRTTTPATVGRNCPKCKGAGRIAMYAGIAGGVCFGCNGAGTITAPADWQEREARAAQRRQAAAAKRASQGANARLWAEFTAAHPDDAALIEANRHADQPDPVLGYAYSSVATYDERDSNPAQALDLVRQYRARH